MMEKYQMQICEQPVPYWDLAGLKYSRDNSPMPIMADESVYTPHDALAVVRENAVDCINIKLMKAGGAYCGARKSPRWLPAPESPVWLAACLRLAWP
jgi:L-alanine-DL-glutamate epimerase-like enolase superfamily enzyme